MHSLKAFIKNHKLDILGILELMVSMCHADTIYNKIRYDEWVGVECVGLGGGI